MPDIEVIIPEGEAIESIARAWASSFRKTSGVCYVATEGIRQHVIHPSQRTQLAMSGAMFEEIAEAGLIVDEFINGLAGEQHYSVNLFPSSSATVDEIIQFNAANIARVVIVFEAVRFLRRNAIELADFRQFVSPPKAAFAASALRKLLVNCGINEIKASVDIQLHERADRSSIGTGFIFSPN